MSTAPAPPLLERHMALTLVADFDTPAKAIVAVDNLSSAGIPKEHIATYPNLHAIEASVPEANEVPSDAPSLPTTGLLTRLQARLANLFNAGMPELGIVSGITELGDEPKQEAIQTGSVFLAVDVSADPVIANTAQLILEKAGALRVALHEVDA